MASRPNSAPSVRPHDVKVPASPKPVPPGGNHSASVPTGVERTAQVLVHEAGGVRKAKKAIDTAAKMERQSEFREDQLAIRLGFPSRQELLAASKPVLDSAGDRWWVTQMDAGSWIAWNDYIVKTNKFSTLAEAQASLANEPSNEEPANGDAFPEGFNG